MTWCTKKWWHHHYFQLKHTMCNWKQQSTCPRVFSKYIQIEKNLIKPQMWHGRNYTCYQFLNNYKSKILARCSIKFKIGRFENEINFHIMKNNFCESMLLFSNSRQCFSIDKKQLSLSTETYLTFNSAYTYINK